MEFFCELFGQQGIRSVLDCACGTRRDVRGVKPLDLRICDMDRSQAMLAQAERNLAAHHLDVPFVQVDYRELPFNCARDFDAVLCLYSSILEMPDESNPVRALVSMRDILRDGGILVLSTGISDRTWREKRRFIPEIDRDVFTRLFVIDYVEKGVL